MMNKIKIYIIEYIKSLFVRQPGIEPGAQRWQRWILPLNHWHFIFYGAIFINIIILLF